MLRFLSLFFALLAGPALAADNAVIITPGSGVTMRSKDIGAGVQSMVQIPGDTAGTPLATAPGVGNASFALPIQGVASGVAVPISGTVTANAGTGNFTVVNGGTFAVQAAQSGTWNITNISGTISLPTGAATAAGLTTINTTLGSPMQNSGGSVTANLGTIAGVATAALQGTNSATTAHTCSTGGFSELGCLGQIDDDIKGSVAAGTNTIGNVNGAPNVTATDCSSTIGTGGTAQNAISAGSSLHGFQICNMDSSAGSGENLWISLTTTAAANTAASYPLIPLAANQAPGCYATPFGFGFNGNLSVIAATTGHKYSCTKW